MQLPAFKLERYLARYEFSTPYPLCCSDCESMTINELLTLAGDEAREGFMGLGLAYTDSRGNLDLRNQIAGLYSGIEADQILVTAGAEEAIFLFMNAALQPGDHLIVQFPCYQSLEAVAVSAGCEVTRWEMRVQNGSWAIDPESLRQMIKPRTRAIVINSPHNPTGYMFSSSELAGIVEIAREHDLLVFSDEVYRLLEYDGRERTASGCELYENAISLGVMSKSFGLAGLRIGWIASRNARIQAAMAAFKDYTSICCSGPSEYLSILALRHRDEIVGRNLGIIEHNLNLLDGFFGRYAEMFTWARPQAGPIAFPSLSNGSGTDDFCAQLVQETGVLLLPATCYDFGDVHFRIGFGRKNMPAALSRLEAWLGQRRNG